MAADPNANVLPLDLTVAEWIEYESQGKGWVKRIDKPAKLLSSADDRRHQVMDQAGVVHLMPGWDTPIFVRYKPVDPTKLLSF